MTGKRGGRPKKWAGTDTGLFWVYAPRWLQDLSRDLGFRTPGDAFYILLRDRALQLLQGEAATKYRDLIGRQEALQKETAARKQRHVAEGEAIKEDPETALDKYYRSLTPNQQVSLRRVVDRYAQSPAGEAPLALNPYQEAIEQRSGVWVIPQVFVRRFAPEVQETPEVARA
jgi:hypothetical protein